MPGSPSDSPAPTPYVQPTAAPTDAPDGAPAQAPLTPPADQTPTRPGASFFDSGVDRGQTQPADNQPTPQTPYGGYQGYGRYPIPPAGVSGDAPTIISGPERHPDNRSLAMGSPPATQTGPRAADAPAAAAFGDYAAPYPQYPTQTRGVAPKRRRRWVAAGLVALALLALIAASYYAFQYAPAQPAVGFCHDLATQRYDDAYALTSQRFRAQLTQAQFVRDLTTLDLAMGAAISCQGAGPLALAYTFPSGPASYRVALVRQPAGASDRTLTGSIHLVASSGAWQVDAIDTSLLGVNLGALQAAQAYCDALGTQHYAAAYALLAGSAQARLTLADYANVEQLHALISGPVKTCGVSGVGQGNNDQRASLTLTIARANLGAQSAAISLTLVGGAWRLVGVPTGAEGPDVGPYEVGQQFCTDLATGRFNAAYDLFTPQYQAQNPRAQFVGALETTQAQGISISCGQPDLTTYSVHGDTAGYVVPYIETYLGVPISTSDTLTFARENGRWLIANSDLQSPLG